MLPTRSFRLLVFLLVVGAPVLAAQEHAHAAPGEKLGTVHFETSCRGATAPQFDRAVALLHSFEVAAAIAGFNSVLAADSSCAMAYWGIALSRWGNPFSASNRPAAQLYADYDRAGQRTRIVNYKRAMGALAAQEPQDTEASVFYALSRSASA